MILKPREQYAKEKVKLEKEPIREEVDVHYAWSVAVFLIIYMGALFFPGIMFMSYVLYLFVPLVLDVNDFFTLFTGVHFITFLLFPLILITCYLTRLFFIALFTRIFWRYTEKKMPTKNGIIPRNFRSKTIEYYHKRSFLIKYPKNAFMKGIFPWLINWLYNFVGTNKVGKGATIEEQFGADKFVDIGKNSYLGVGSGISSHVVEGIFGNIPYFEIKIGDNSTCAARTTLGPGCNIQRDSYLFPMACGTKFNETKGNNYYFGMPFRKIFKKKIMEYLKVSEEDLARAEELRIKRNGENG
ncbi:MAG: hypothetical protein ACTSYC_01610 [Promethearchaeota archaeon]